MAKLVPAAIEGIGSADSETVQTVRHGRAIGLNRLAIEGIGSADSETVQTDRAAVPNAARHVAAVSAPAIAITGPTATIRGIKRTVLPDAVRIVIELDTEVMFHEERIASPDRVFLDLTPARATPALRNQTLRFQGDADVVRQV